MPPPTLFPPPPVVRTMTLDALSLGPRHRFSPPHQQKKRRRTSSPPMSAHTQNNVFFPFIFFFFCLRARVGPRRHHRRHHSKTHSTTANRWRALPFQWCRLSCVTSPPSPDFCIKYRFHWRDANRSRFLMAFLDRQCLFVWTCVVYVVANG